MRFLEDAGSGIAGYHPGLYLDADVLADVAGDLAQVGGEQVGLALAGLDGTHGAEVLRFVDHAEETHSCLTQGSQGIDVNQRMLGSP
jgi:hypothetical protein